MNDTLPIAAVVIGERVRKDMGDIEALAKSITEHGLLHPVVVRPDLTLIAGERRLRACKALGWSDIPVRIVDVADLLKAERAENEDRKSFTPSEAVAIAKVIEDATREQAAQRKREAGRIAGLKSAEKRGVLSQSKVVENFHNLEQGRTRDITAAAVGMSGPTYYRAKRVVEAAEQEPAKFGDLVETMDRTGKVHGVYTELERRKKGEPSKPLREPKTKRHAVHRKMHYPKPNREVQRAVIALDGVCTVLDHINVDQLDSEKSEQWAIELKKYSAAIARFARRLRDERGNDAEAQGREERLEVRDGADSGTEDRPRGATQAVGSVG